MHQMAAAEQLEAKPSQRPRELPQAEGVPHDVRKHGTPAHPGTSATISQRQQRMLWVVERDGQQPTWRHHTMQLSQRHLKIGGMLEMIESRIGQNQIKLVGSQRQATHIAAVNPQAGVSLLGLGDDDRRDVHAMALSPRQAEAQQNIYQAITKRFIEQVGLEHLREGASLQP